MNLKKAKQIRKTLRAMGINPKEKSYNSGERLVKKIDSLDTRTGKTVKKSFMYQGTIALKPECGRAKYLNVKAGMRA